MIPEFVAKWEDRKDKVRAQFEEKHPSYPEIVRAVVEILHDNEAYENPDPKRITLIDHGDCQGNLLFIIASDTYQPYTYWFVRVFYGSCSGCDSLAMIRGFSDDPPTPEQVKDYMTLAMHIVQRIKLLD